jgi:hypothetical protein
MIIDRFLSLDSNHDDNIDVDENSLLVVETVSNHIVQLDQKWCRAARKRMLQISMMLTLVMKDNIGRVHLNVRVVFDLLIVMRNCPICRNELNDDSVMEKPAAKVVNAAMKTAEPTRDTDSITRISRSTQSSLDQNEHIARAKQNKIHRYLAFVVRTSRKPTRMTFSLFLLTIAFMRISMYVANTKMNNKVHR